MSKKVKVLIKNILKHYVSKEESIEGEYRYFTHDEFDGNNATKFEELSNARFIGIKSKLPEEDIVVIMSIFQEIVDDNYWKFDIDELMALIDNDNIDEEKLNNNDINEWIKALFRTGNEFTTTDNIPIEEVNHLLREYTTGKLANPEFEFFQQKYFYIFELNTKMKFRPTVALV